MRERAAGRFLIETTDKKQPFCLLEYGAGWLYHYMEYRAGWLCHCIQKNQLRNLSRYAKAASMNPRNSGWGRFGRDFNSGCAWVAINQG